MKEEQKTLLVWDIDDVLNQFMLHCLPRFPSQRLFRYEELTVNPPYELLGISKEQYLATLDASRADLYQLPPRREILDFFEKYGDCFHHASVSAVPLRFASDSAQWLLHHFGKWIQTFCFIPSPRPGMNMRSQQFHTKSDAIKAFNREAVLIDDAPGNVVDACNNGITAILFPAPWNDNRNQTIDDFLNKLLDFRPKC